MRTFLALILFLTLLPMGLAQVNRARAGDTVMKIEIEGRGNVLIKLFTKEAPKTTAHILQLARTGFYNGLRFHRVEKSPRPYLVQVGDPDSRSGELQSNSDRGSGTTVPYEDTGFTHEEGTVGLARNPRDPNSGDSQFYITLGPAKFLDGKYTIFGKVVSGMGVVRNIERGDRIVSVTVQ